MTWIPTFLKNYHISVFPPSKSKFISPLYFYFDVWSFCCDNYVILTVSVLTVATTIMLFFNNYYVCCDNY